MSILTRVSRFVLVDANHVNHATKFKLHNLILLYPPAAAGTKHLQTTGGR